MRKFTLTIIATLMLFLVNQASAQMQCNSNRVYTVYAHYRTASPSCANTKYTITHGGAAIDTYVDQGVAPADLTYGSGTATNWKRLATGVTLTSSNTFTVSLRANTETGCSSGIIIADAILVVDDLGNHTVIDNVEGTAFGSSWVTETAVATNFHNDAQYVNKATSGSINNYFNWVFTEVLDNTDSD